MRHHFAAVLCLALTPFADADEIRTNQLGGLAVEIATFPGAVADLAAHPEGGLVVLVDPPEAEPGPTSGESEPQGDPAPPRVVLWSAGALRTLVSEAPPRARGFVRRGDELWLGVRMDSETRAEGLFRLDASEDGTLERLPGSWTRLAEHERRGLLAEPARADVGELQLLDGNHGVTGHIRLPVEAQRRGRKLQLESPPVTRLEDPETGSVSWIAGPRAVGADRLLLWKLDPQGGEPEEIWCRLPGREDVSTSEVVLIAGQPVLVAFTTPADKIGALAKLAMRAWPLRTDRTRAGLRPSLEHETPTRHWNRPRALARDLDGDGREELVVVEPRGLGAGELVVDAFRASPSLRFGEMRRTDFDAADAEWEITDVDGDEAPDLITLSQEGFEIRRGLPDHRRKVFESKPWIAHALDELPGKAPDPEHHSEIELYVVTDVGSDRPTIALVRNVFEVLEGGDADSVTRRIESHVTRFRAPSTI